VAVKALDFDTSLNKSKREVLNRRFLWEAQVSAQLAHPNIVTIHDVMITEETGFIVMQFVAGTTLQRLMDRRAISTERCLDIVAQVARGLGYAHQHNVIHRDIKPGNILVSASNEARITDFGIAKSDHASHVTSSGSIVGTPDYMSPEQASGEDVDARSDIFSLGCVLFECLVGAKAFRGRNVTAVLLSIVNSDPFTSEAWTSSPFSEVREVADILRRALAKRPAERFASANEFLSALEGLPADLVLPSIDGSVSERTAPRAEAGADSTAASHHTVIVSEEDEPASAEPPTPRPTRPTPPTPPRKEKRKDPTLDARHFLREDNRPLVFAPNASDELQGISLTPAQGYVLSRIDGALRAREILALSPLEEEEVAATLADLLDRGLLRHADESHIGTKRTKARPTKGRFDRRGYAEGLYRRAKEAYQGQDYWGAIQLARQAIELDQLEPSYHHLLGLGLMRNRNWQREAEESLRKAVALEPSNTTYLASLADLYRSRGDNEQAEATLEKARAIDPHFAAQVT
jgi:serine/threonine protein kinase